MACDVTIARVDGVPVPRLVGELDLSTAGAVRRPLLDAARDRPSAVLDLSEVTFVDVSGLNVLLDVRSGLAGSSGVVALVRPCASLRLQLDVLGLDTVFPSCDDVPSALALVTA